MNDSTSNSEKSSDNSLLDEPSESDRGKIEEQSKALSASSSSSSSQGITASNNFLGLPPPPYAMSTLKNSFSSMSVETFVPEAPTTPTNTNTQLRTGISYRRTSRSFVDLTQADNPFHPMYQRSASPYVPNRTTPFSQSREKERLELSTLNDKFADYVEKVRYLEAQNKKIQLDSNFLNEKQNEYAKRIKSLFESEMKQLKEIIEKTFKEKSTMIVAAKDAQNLLPSMKHQLNQNHKELDGFKYDSEKLERQLSSIEADMLMYQRRLTHQDREHGQWKQFISHLQRLLVQGRNEIHNEIIARTSCEQATKQLKLEINQFREQNQEKLNDLRQNSLMLGTNSGTDRAQMFRSDLSSAIRKVRQDFDRENDLQRQQLYSEFTRTYEEMARQYPEFGHLFLNEREQERVRQEEDRIRMEIQRVRADSNVLKQKNAELKFRMREFQINIEMSNEENRRIRQMQENEIEQLKDRHEKIAQDYDEVMSKQISLEKEIETYRNLLEGTMKSVVETIEDERSPIVRPKPINPSTNVSSNLLSGRTSRASSVDRSAFTPILSKKSETNFYSSLINPKYDGKPSNESSFLTVDIPLAERSNGSANRNDEDLSKSNNGENETTSASSTSLPPRPPIILQTRRNN